MGKGSASGCYASDGCFDTSHLSLYSLNRRRASMAQAMQTSTCSGRAALITCCARMSLQGIRSHASFVFMATRAERAEYVDSLKIWHFANDLQRRHLPITSLGCQSIMIN